MRAQSAKGNILETASILFYECGFNDTSLEDIAVRCSVTRPAIIYHFGSKPDLGAAVANLYERRQEEGFEKIIRKRVGPIDQLTIYAARALWMPGFLVADAKAARFYQEFVSENQNFASIVQTQEERYLQFAKIDTDADLEDQIKKVGAIFAGKGLLDCFLKGLFDCSVEEFSRYFLMNYLMPFIESQARFDELYKEALTLLQTADIKVMPFFKVR